MTSGDAASGEVVKGSDTRLTNSRTPTAHASTHYSGAGDPLTGSLDANARLAVAKAGSTTGTRRKVNFIEGTNITMR